MNGKGKLVLLDLFEVSQSAAIALNNLDAALDNASICEAIE